MIVALLQRPIQVPKGGYPWISPLPHHFQHGGGRSDSSMGHSGVSRGGGTRSIHKCGPMDVSIILGQKWDPRLAPPVPPAVGTGCLDRDFQQGWSPDQCQQNGGGGIPDMSHFCRALGGGTCK